MFKLSSKKPITNQQHDLSNVLRDRSNIKLGAILNPLEGVQGDLSAIAVDPLGGWLAVGTLSGAIYLTGSSTVYVPLSIYHTPPEPLWKGITSVKFLCFHPGHQRLVAIDSKSQVHIWDLGLIDPKTNIPYKEATNSLYNKVTSIDLPSASTSHLPVTFKDGATGFIDLSRSAFLAPYKIPNVWAKHESRLRASGIEIPASRSSTGPPMSIGVNVNPRDRNLMLIAYEGGVILWDLEKKESRNTFELSIMPGAPGAAGYSDPNLFTERTPGVTCICWKPDGLVFAVGYDDGCIAIWSVDDSDKPLSVRTVDEEDVNITNAESLFESGALEPGSVTEGSLPKSLLLPREPIFKLSWTSFPSSTTLNGLVPPPSPETIEFSQREETILVILGGQSPSINPQGVTLLQFPAFHPPAAAVAPPSGGLSSNVRAAFKDSLISTGTFVYPTERPCEDFCLVPRADPHYGLTFDPVGIIFIIGSVSDRAGWMSGRGLKAYSFPPVRSTKVAVSKTRREPQAEVGEDEFVPISAPPKTLVQVNAEPSVFSPQAWGFALSGDTENQSDSDIEDKGKGWAQPFVGSSGFGEWSLSARLWCGVDSIGGSWLKPITSEGLRRIGGGEGRERLNDGNPRLWLNGGKAHGKVDGDNFKGLKLEPHRLLVTFHLNHLVRFFDISSQLLLFPSPLTNEYPDPLSNLTIDLPSILRNPTISHTPIAQSYARDPNKVSVQTVEFASTTLEVAVILSTGAIIYFKYGPAPIPSSPSSSSGPEFTDLRHLSSPTPHLDGFQPQFILDVNRGPVGACAVSDAGFLAVGFLQNSLAVVNLREPEIILGDGFSEQGETTKTEGSIVGSLRWTVVNLGADSTPAIRLIASGNKGLIRIFSLHYGLAGWEIERKPVVCTYESLGTPLSCFVLDLKSGEELALDPRRLEMARASSDAQQIGGAQKSSHAGSQSVMILAGKKGLRSQLNLNGERIGKVEVQNSLKAVFLVYKHGGQVLVAFAENSDIYVYSVPALDLIIHIPSRETLGEISMDPFSGDYLDYRSPLDIRFHTLFNTAKPQDPQITLDTLRPPIPAHPVPVKSSVIASWLGTWGGGTLTGAQIDALIAGPKRPTALPKPNFASPPTTDLTDATTTTYTRGTSSGLDGKPIPVRSTARSSRAGGRNDPFREMAEAAEERGNMLDGLQDTMKDIGRQASEWQEQARRTAMKESVKTSARSFFKF